LLSLLQLKNSINHGFHEWHGSGITLIGPIRTLHIAGVWRVRGLPLAAVTLTETLVTDASHMATWMLCSIKLIVVPAVGSQAARVGACCHGPMLTPNVAAVGEFGALLSAHNEPPSLPQCWYLVAKSKVFDVPSFKNEFGIFG
jgi:hypothetical protein